VLYPEERDAYSGNFSFNGRILSCFAVKRGLLNWTGDRPKEEEAEPHPQGPGARGTCPGPRLRNDPTSTTREKMQIGKFSHTFLLLSCFMP
jgi:hypothetical protein